MATLVTFTAGTVISPTDVNANFTALNTEVRTAAVGGTGQSSYTIGDLLYASASTTLSKLSDVATGQVLTSGGVGAAPAWSASPTLSGTLTMSGTGPVMKLSGGTDIQILIGSGTDPGWSVAAVQWFDGAGGGSTYATGGSVFLGANVYYDGAAKSQAGGRSAAIEMTNASLMKFYSSDSVASSAAYTYVERLRIDTNTAASETALLVSINGAAVQRVSIGAADSGGAGFRVMRVAN